MKKLLLVVAMVAASFTANAQDGSFNLGVNLGLPTGDAGDAYSFGMALEANYLFEVSDAFKVGPSLSYMHYFGKERTFTNGGVTVTTDVEDASFIPLAVAGRFSLSDEFTLGGDLGYGIGISPDGNDGGFYYRPMLGYNISENAMIQASYSGVSVEGGTFSNFGLGVMFSL